MYQYKEDAFPIDKGYVLDWLGVDGQLNILKILLGMPHLSIKRKLQSPLRFDRHGKCYYDISPTGKVYLKDWGKTTHNSDIFDHIIYFKLAGSFEEALKVAMTMGKEVDKGGTVYRPTTDFRISFHDRDYDKSDNLYWKPIGVTPDMLKKDEVYPVSHFAYWWGSEEGQATTNVFTGAYAYAICVNSKTKIYRPYEEEYKWVSNFSRWDIGFLNRLKGGKHLIINKGYKDSRLDINAGYDSCFASSEFWEIPFMVLHYLANLYDTITILYDNDSTGVYNANMLVQHGNSLFPGKFRCVFHTLAKDNDKVARLFGVDVLHKELKNML